MTHLATLGHGLPLGSEIVEVRPCVGVIMAGDRVAVSPERPSGFFTVKRAADDDVPLGIALSNSHTLGFVAIRRNGDGLALTPPDDAQ
jgi:hypothetical protein